jgi:hypothetical protein
VSVKKRKSPKEPEQETTTSATPSDARAAHAAAPRTEQKAEPPRPEAKAEHAHFEE